MMKYIENYKDGTKKKLLQLIDGFSEIAGYEINTHRFVAFVHTNSETVREKNKGNSVLYDQIRRKKYLGINLFREKNCVHELKK